MINDVWNNGFLDHILFDIKTDQKLLMMDLCKAVRVGIRKWPIIAIFARQHLQSPCKISAGVVFELFPFNTGAYILKASIGTPTIPQKNWTFRKCVQKCHKMAQKWPKWPNKAQSGPNITPNGPKWPNMALEWPKMIQSGPPKMIQKGPKLPQMAQKWRPIPTL